jgi:hypothetical protein
MDNENKRQMKKKMICLLFFSMALSMTPMFASENKALIVELQSGSQTTFFLSEKPVLTFANHVLKIVINQESCDYEISNVKYFYFSDQSSDVQQLKANNVNIVYQSKDKVVIEGVSENDQIQIYSAKGIMQKGIVGRNGNNVEVSLSALPTGVYLISVQNKQTIKIFKK